MPGAITASVAGLGPDPEGHQHGDDQEERQRQAEAAAGADRQGQVAQQERRSREGLLEGVVRDGCGLREGRDRSSDVRARAAEVDMGGDQGRCRPRQMRLHGRGEEARHCRQSSETVGSSSAQIGRPVTSSRASPRRRFWPADRSRAGRSRERHQIEALQRRRDRPGAVDAGPETQVLGHRQRATSARRHGRHRRCCLRPPRSSPDSGGWRPASVRRSVVFPAPFGPRRIRACPGAEARLTPDRTGTPPRAQDRSRTSSVMAGCRSRVRPAEAQDRPGALPTRGRCRSGRRRGRT